MNANEITTDQSMGLGGTNAETLKTCVYVLNTSG
jgi:hypothetical protein